MKKTSFYLVSVLILSTCDTCVEKAEADVPQLVHVHHQEEGEAEEPDTRYATGFQSITQIGLKVIGIGVSARYEYSVKVCKSLKIFK